MKKKMGFSDVDVLLSIALVVVFIVGLTMVYKSSYYNTIRVKKTSQAMNYLINETENIQSSTYTGVSSLTKVAINNDFSKQIDVVNLNSTDTQLLDLIKKITVTIYYKVGPQQLNISLTTIKTNL